SSSFVMTWKTFGFPVTVAFRAVLRSAASYERGCGRGFVPATTASPLARHTGKCVQALPSPAHNLRGKNGREKANTFLASALILASRYRIHSTISTEDGCGTTPRSDSRV